MDQLWLPLERYGAQQVLSMSLVGDEAKACYGLQSVLRGTDVNEIMANGQILDHQACLYSFELVMDMKEELLGQYVLAQEALSEMTTLPYTIPDKRNASGIVQAAEMSDKTPLIIDTPAAN